ncbi:hypothetical protein RvY_15288 [Ramazzottius varieornatus]|uniref:Uncharacterized protein n=1 Tax=Ramazzottius varieornatus TaxID=947166 RepID=A0A1D1VVP2_RAMVA|nr:hypothetical protein RvY_15288 [Ramazzottius varieornatus]
MAELDRAANQLLLRWLDFAIGNLADYPIEFQLLTSRIAALLSTAVSALTLPTPAVAPLSPSVPSNIQSTVTSSFSRGTLGRSSIRRPLLSTNTFAPLSPTSPTPASPLATTSTSSSLLERLLQSTHPQGNISHREVRPGWFRAKLSTEHGQRLYEYAASSKELSPEQVRLFLDDAIPKAKATSAVLLTNGTIGGSQRIDIFGAGMNHNEFIPVLFLSNFPKDNIIAEKLLRVADEILTFLIKTQASAARKDQVLKVFTIMPKVCHVLSLLLDFMAVKGDQLRSTVSLHGKSLLPEYRALSLSGRRIVQSRLTPEGASVATTTTTNRKSIRGGRTVTETTTVTSKLQRMTVAQSIPRRFPKEAQNFIQREIDKFNQGFEI